MQKTAFAKHYTKIIKSNYFKAFKELILNYQL